MNEFRWSTACIGLEQHYSGNIVTVVLGRENGLITGPVVDQEEKQVVWSGHRLRFRRSAQLKLKLESAVDVLESWISI